MKKRLAPRVPCVMTMLRIPKTTIRSFDALWPSLGMRSRNGAICEVITFFLANDPIALRAAAWQKIEEKKSEIVDRVAAELRAELRAEILNEVKK